MALPEEASKSSLTGLSIKTTPHLASSNLNNHPIEPSPYNSPSLVSPPSSAFVSALQSPYISPRATGSQPPAKPTPLTQCECSDDIPSSSYTPPSDHYEFSDGPPLKFVTCSMGDAPASAPPRISFSFPVPRISFGKGGGGGGPISPASTNAKLRSCDVYIGFHGHNPNLVRFSKWLKSELELQGIACFVADRAKYSDNQSHEIADRVICSVAFAVVVVTSSSFVNHFSMEEIRFFSQKKNLIPIFFDSDPGEIMSLLSYNSVDKECKEAVNGVIKCHEFKLEANEGNWRNCLSRTAGILCAKLGRKSAVGADLERLEDLSFPRNNYFVGREKELVEIETALFGCSGESADKEYSTSASSFKGETSGQSEGQADEEMDSVATTDTDQYISLEIGKFREPALEARVEQPPVIGRNSLSRSKYREYSKCVKKTEGCSVICVHGVPGIGKTELALEFAYRYAQRYKMVLWVGGEAPYFRQNILNLSMCLGLDVSADEEKERGRIRSFEEQELEAFKRVKKALFRDMPYLLIIDNLETEKEWWEGKNLHDLIPRDTGGSHIIITTRLPKVMSFDTMQLLTLPFTEAMVLIRGTRKKDYPAEELEYLKKFDEKLGRLSYGLWVIGSLLSELGITPSSLFEAISQVPIDEASSTCTHISINEDQYCKNNHFLMKMIYFCYAFSQQTEGGKYVIASRMLLVGAWFAQAPISATLLASAANNTPAASPKGFGKWAKCLSLSFSCCPYLSSQHCKSDEDPAHFLIKLGLARRANPSKYQHPAAGLWIQFHPITQLFFKRKEGLAGARSTVEGVRKAGNPLTSFEHLWASAFLVFGFKSEPPLVQLKALDLVLYIGKTALPLAIRAFTSFSRCISALELLKVCTNALEEVEKSFVCQIQDWCQMEYSLCWKKKKKEKEKAVQRVDEDLWQDVTLLKATLLETRAKLLLRGGHFDSGEELCRTCISIRSVMLGHNHAQTVAAQETLAKLVRMRSKM